MNASRQNQDQSVIAMLSGRLGAINESEGSFLMGNVSIMAGQVALPVPGTVVTVNAHFNGNVWQALAVYELGQVLPLASAPAAQQQPQTAPVTTTTTSIATPATAAEPSASSSAAPPSAPANARAFGFGRSTLEQSAPEKPRYRPEPRTSTFSMPKRPVAPVSEAKPAAPAPTPVARPAPSATPAQAAAPARASTPAPVDQAPARRGGFSKASNASPAAAAPAPAPTFEGRSMGSRKAFSKAPELAYEQAQLPSEPAQAPRGTLNKKPRGDVLKAWRLDQEEMLEDINY